MRRIALVFAFALLLLGIGGCEAGSITYDSGSNTIKVVGFSESSPCTFEDIYQADVSNGWGVVSKQGDNQYYFSCTLQIGDGSTETWLADENKAISFTGDKGYIYVFKYGHLRLGHIVNEEKRTTRNGCYLYNNASEYYYLILCNDGGVIEIYSSLLKAKKGASLTLYGSGHKIWNSVISSYITGQSHIDMYRTTIQSVTHGVRFIPTYANDIIISNAWYAIDLYSISGDKTVKNLKLIDEITSFRTYNFNGNLHAINTICKWTFSWGWNSNGKIYRQYTYNLKVVDEEGNPISGAKVSVYNRSGYLEFEDITDANGQIPEQIVTRGYYDQAHGKTLVDFSPHTLVIEKEGYETYTMQFTPTEAIDWQISLKKAEEQETVGEGIIEVKEERKGKSDIGEGLVLGFEFGIALLAIAFFVMKGGGRE